MQGAERIPKSVLLAQAETSVVYFASTAGFSNKYVSNQTTNARGNKYNAPPTMFQLLTVIFP